MIHLNRNILAALAIKTTGPDAQKHEIIEIAIIPLNEKCEIDKSKIPFNLMLKPERPELVDYSFENEYLMHVCTVGFEKYDAAELFEAWFLKLKLLERKKIMILAHDWASKRDFIKEWLQPTSFGIHFDHRYRDPQAIGLFMNDVFDRKTEPCPFPKVKLGYMSSVQKVEYEPRLPSVIDECQAVINLYHSLVYKEMM